MKAESGSESLLVVLGATGNQGNAVLRYFASTDACSDYSLRGITRDVNSSAAQQLKALGVDMVQADLNDPRSLENAFYGATHIFATTDSNRLIFEAIKDGSILSENETPRSYAGRIEMAQGVSIAEAAASCTTLRRIVWSSLPSPKKWSQGKFSNVSMFDTKADIADYMSSKVNLQQKLSVLLIGFYATNALSAPALYSPQKQKDGVYELALPMSGDVKIPMVDVEMEVGAWVYALFKAQPGTVLVGVTENLTWKEWLAAWAQCNQVEARFRQASLSEYSQLIPGISEAVAEEFAFVESFGFAGGNPDAITPDDVMFYRHEIEGLPS